MGVNIIRYFYLYLRHFVYGGYSYISGLCFSMLGIVYILKDEEISILTIKKRINCLNVYKYIFFIVLLNYHIFINFVI